MQHHIFCASVFIPCIALEKKVAICFVAFSKGRNNCQQLTTTIHPFHTEFLFLKGNEIFFAVIILPLIDFNAKTYLCGAVKFHFLYCRNSIWLVENLPKIHENY